MSTAAIDPVIVPPAAPPAPDAGAPPAGAPPAGAPPADPTPPADPKPPAAIDYSSVILPKDAAIDPAALEKTVATARAQGFSAEQAQATVDLINEQVGATRAALLESYQPGGAAWTTQLDAWKAETLADPTLGKTPEERTAAVQRGASVLKRYAEANPADAKGMEAFLNTSGLGEHPAVVRLFNWLGKAAGERPLVSGSDASVGGNAIARTYQESGMNP